MLDFKFHQPNSLTDALSLLAQHGKAARILAGGTDMLIYLRSRRNLEGVEHIVDINSLQDLDYIREDGDTLRVGCLATHTQVAQSQLIRQHAGLLGQATAVVGSPQVRNRGTMGGNIANAAVCADTIAPLVALEACVKLEKVCGHRWLPLEDFITGPNRTQLEASEMLTEIAFAKLPTSAGWGFTRLARREALAIARMNVGVVLDTVGGKINYASIAPGSVLPRPARITAAEQLLLGQVPSQDLARQAGEAVAATMVEVSGRRWSTDYKEPVIIALVERAIKQAMGVEWR